MNFLTPTTVYLFVKYSYSPMHKNLSSLETGNSPWLLGSGGYGLELRFVIYHYKPLLLYL